MKPGIITPSFECHRKSGPEQILSKKEIHHDGGPPDSDRVLAARPANRRTLPREGTAGKSRRCPHASRRRGSRPLAPRANGSLSPLPRNDGLSDRRSEERRVGEECVSTCRYRGSTYNDKNKENR